MKKRIASNSKQYSSHEHGHCLLLAGNAKQFNKARKGTTMQLPPIHPDDFDPRLQSLLADILRLRGQVYNLHRVLAHSPKTLFGYDVAKTERS